ncbi:MAG: DUF3181 family protein [Synechococcales cyanobacterium K44_A2020_017]|uniref:DUF3181 family protein n=1 Tax=Leptolyngbya sp. CCY15150 TaxID=2767772 RepID=UPI0019515EAF|nr:DUF3181 family protein [Leptolyngbya sp. CCY15150]MBF2088585.1 DUF3181 family protein [Synechococcales cyanobacterium K32_A2020_035]MBF2095372.1 DUF3181 family protein [Synechococcales cyanobacterium K44_A2020_017]
MTHPISNEAIEKLAAEIGEQIYIDVAKWHLYLRDAKLHTTLSEQLYPLLESDPIDSSAVEQILASTMITLGEQRQVPLSDLVPTRIQSRLVDLLEDYQRKL